MSSSTLSGSTDALIGSVLLDRYRLDELLGEGGMGKVYAAEHVLMRKRLAVKVLHRELCDVAEVVARFEREAMATANIDHPNIAAATDCGKLSDGSLFLVLELAVGKNLRDEIASAAPMPVPRALQIARQIASALAAAHALEIVHRDLKPENVMLVSRGAEQDFVKVLDFGIAKLPADSGSAGPLSAGPLTKTGVVFGTPEYMSPEQALGQAVDGRADLYALGVITYELLSGVRPYPVESAAGLLGQQLSKPIPSFAERAPQLSIPRQIEDVVHKLLASDLASRYQTAIEVVQAFDELLQPIPRSSTRTYTLPDGSPTSFLGTAREVHGSPTPEVTPEPGEPGARDAGAPEPPPAPAPALGPTGTLALLDAEQADQLAARVAGARAVAGTPTWKLQASQLIAASRDVIETACRCIDDNRARLPPNVERPLRRLPALALLSLATLLTWGPLLILFAFIATSGKKPDASGIVARSDVVTAPDAGAPDPVLKELEEAEKSGSVALAALAEKHPKHPRVLLALGATQSAGGEHGAAVASLKKALAAGATLNEEPKASAILVAAVRKRDSAAASFALIEGPMGAAGAAIAYDLSFDQRAPAAARTRAQKWVVLDPQFLELASPPVEVAAKLRYGKSCSDRHKLLKRVGEVGDERALAYLKIMKYRGGCGRRGKDDCFSCLRKDSALSEALKSVEARVNSNN